MTFANRDIDTLADKLLNAQQAQAMSLSTLLQALWLDSLAQFEWKWNGEFLELEREYITPAGHTHLIAWYLHNEHGFREEAVVARGVEGKLIEAMLSGDHAEYGRILIEAMQETAESWVMRSDEWASLRATDLEHEKSTGQPDACDLAKDLKGAA